MVEPTAEIEWFSYLLTQTIIICIDRGDINIFFGLYM